MNKKIIIVDDELAVGGLVQHIVEELGFNSEVFADPQHALKEILKQQPFLVISDLSMSSMSGVELLTRCKEKNSDIEFIIMTGYGTVESAVEAMDKGALNYIQKPLNLDHLRHLIKQASEKIELIGENQNLQKRLHEQDILSAIIGSSPNIQKVKELIRKVAPSDAGVMITGESGTGKELVARAIHNCSRRKTKELITVDCVALPEKLFESELFGYEKGSFTGADQARKGLMEVADKGTFFMDEITELDYGLQAKLLRVLQEYQFRRLGGNKVIDVDIRVVAATRRDPQLAVEEGLFREDLFYRLNVIPIHLPALRERREDIPQLIQHFLNLESKKNSNQLCEVDPKAMESLINYRWPGNIRELRNVILRMSILCKENMITFDDLPLSISEQQSLNSFDLSWAIPLPFKDAKEIMLDHFEREYLRQHLAMSHGNISQAALESGVNRKTFHRLINKYNISVYK
ncbi:MAG: sigma-54 dependent transcriptional regulator [Lentisphaeraceae bacterium]|nr:sigma-54 dependent transcriptional regulator [Lentisphaeraceae bacterium]